MRMPYKKKNLAMAIGLAAFSVGAVAQTDTTPETRTLTLEELVVTAQKREQDMQDTPISMAAFGAEALQSQGIHDISNASQYLANVQIAESPGGSTGATIAMRGSVTVNPAVTWEPTVGIYVDGVFVAKNVGGLFEVAELERMEVLRGPQGTLYGKNTTGGAINLITRKPGEEFGGTARLSVGNYNYTEAYLSVDSGRINDMAQFNVAINKRDRDGFYDNNSTAPGAVDEFKELDSLAGRFSALVDISEELELYYTYDMSEKDNTPSFGQFDARGTKLERRDEGELDGTRFDTSESFGHALHLTWDVDDHMVFKSITAYREMTFHDYSDFDGFGAYDVSDPTQAPTIVHTDGNTYSIFRFHAERHFQTEQFSQEFQLLGTAGAVDYVVGAYYLNEDTVAYNPFHVGATVDNWYGVEGDSYALFGQADWHIDHAWTLTAGLRWTREEKDAYLARRDGTGGNNFGGDIPLETAKETWSNVSPMAAISYLWENGMNTYFKVAQGWKAGGFNGEAASAAVFANPYDEEKVTSYELGMKARWYDERVQTNIALFYNDITDEQISHFLGAYSDVRNAGESEVKGLELEVLAQLTERLTANFNYGYLDAKYKTFLDAAGNERKDTAKFRYAPSHTWSAGLMYRAQLNIGELRARLDYSYSDDYYIYDDPDNAEASKIDRYGLLNARVSIADMQVGNGQLLEVGLWGKNLTDEEYRINGIPVVGVDMGTGNQATVGGLNYYGDPRTFGADLTFKF